MNAPLPIPPDGLTHGETPIDPYLDVRATYRATDYRIVIAVGTRPARPDGVAFDERTVVDSDGIGGDTNSV